MNVIVNIRVLVQRNYDLHILQSSKRSVLNGITQFYLHPHVLYPQPAARAEQDLAHYITSVTNYLTLLSFYRPQEDGSKPESSYLLAMQADLGYIVPPYSLAYVSTENTRNVIAYSCIAASRNNPKIEGAFRPTESLALSGPDAGDKPFS